MGVCKRNRLGGQFSCRPGGEPRCPCGGRLVTDGRGHGLFIHIHVYGLTCNIGANIASTLGNAIDEHRC